EAGDVGQHGEGAQRRADQREAHQRGLRLAEDDAALEVELDALGGLIEPCESARRRCRELGVTARRKQHECESHKDRCASHRLPLLRWCPCQLRGMFPMTAIAVFLTRNL